jgi:hypothetical protein
MLDLDVRASPRCSESLFLTLLVRDLISSYPGLPLAFAGGGIAGNDPIRARRDKK